MPFYTTVRARLKHADPQAAMEAHNGVVARIIGTTKANGGSGHKVFADAAGKSTADITAMFDSGKGWGEIRRELGLTIGPGLGWIMGHGHDKAKKADKDGSRDEAPGD